MRRFFARTRTINYLAFPSRLCENPSRGATRTCANTTRNSQILLGPTTQMLHDPPTVMHLIVAAPATATACASQQRCTLKSKQLKPDRGSGYVGVGRGSDMGSVLRAWHTAYVYGWIAALTATVTVSRTPRSETWSAVQIQMKEVTAHTDTHPEAAALHILIMRHDPKAPGLRNNNNNSLDATRRLDSEINNARCHVDCSVRPPSNPPASIRLIVSHRPSHCPKGLTTAPSKPWTAWRRSDYAYLPIDCHFESLILPQNSRSRHFVLQLPLYPNTHCEDKTLPQSGREPLQEGMHANILTCSFVSLVNVLHASGHNGFPRLQRRLPIARIVRHLNFSCYVPSMYYSSYHSLAAEIFPCLPPTQQDTQTTQPHILPKLALSPMLGMVSHQKRAWRTTVPFIACRVNLFLLILLPMLARTSASLCLIVGPICGKHWYQIMLIPTPRS
ncbi:uncharacterized protein MYCFIDRAFT_180279 [Pseudocercospora fijiensis CIRAD86]|uniref:Uncharacterized protein n=1 Tax=Pseudocercospora fijiensis (strain CIRAD86) TaxID=383855 RepID=M3AIV4_PSEFD|nr:uncharacterized protein MYCFIDRAFT_180279 [Pseudocercospora fijiensis CIRAD86]EME77123.1 hypothetical protein MYCFIDRAFT_180279 [Pseudocercospora fijiensis CIRAD86]